MSFLPLFTSIAYLFLRFVLGSLFGAFFWWIVIEPYTKYYSFGNACPMILLVVSLATGTLFALSIWMRSVMVLFLPSMIGNASQNYIIMLLFINLFSGPVHSVAMNAVESIRVIGCSLTLTFEHLKDKAKLIMAPVVEVLTGSIKDDINAVGGNLSDIQTMIEAIKDEAEFSRNQTDLLKLAPVGVQSPRELVDTKIINDIQQRLNLNKTKSEEIVNKTRDLLQSSRLEVDGDKLALKASIDSGKLKQLLKANASVSIEQFNITKILYENCLGVFRGAKSQCEAAVQDMRQSCQDSVGSFLATVFCSPTLFTLESICPWILDQVIDERTICNNMQSAMARRGPVDPFNLTGGADINLVYKNLTSKLSDLKEEIVREEGEAVNEAPPKRLELSISINDNTLRLLLKTRELWLFITDKYKWRHAFLQLLSFLYEVYTTLTFLFILGQAINYQRNYLRNIKFDNSYVTGMFRSLDYKRRMARKESVLPLTREESERYIPTLTCKRRTSEERRVQKSSCTVILLFLVLTLSLMYIDDIFYSILVSIHDHALIRFRELGHHQLRVQVDGDGPLAQTVRRLASHFNTTYDLNKISTTRQCLPRPQTTSGRLHLQYLYLVCSYIFIDQMSIYALRLRRIIVAFYYTQKEQQRVAYLYNLILVNRRKLKRTGLLPEQLDPDDDDEFGASTTSRDGSANVFTLRDAMVYMKDCIGDSFCCGASRCFNFSSSGRHNDRMGKAANLAPVVYKLLQSSPSPKR